MKPTQHANQRTALTFALGIGMAILPVTAQAYVGPGAGLTAIGTMVALIAALLLAVVGFVWYPIKRMMRSGKPPANAPDTAEPRE